jgi:hypothetical protein
VSASVLNSQRKEIVNLNYDRYKLKRTEKLSFNATNNLYMNNSRTYEYYIPGGKNISINCSYPGGVNGTTGYIIISGLAPVISFTQMNNSLGFFALTTGTLIEYAKSSYDFYSSVSAYDLANITYSIQNSTAILANFTVKANAIVNLTYLNFLQFSNPYYFNISAYDGSGLGLNSSISFNITDTVFPTYSGLINDTVTNNSAYAWNIMLYDESLLSFYMNCSNGDNRSANLGYNRTYSWSNASSILTSHLICSFNVSDGHSGLYSTSYGSFMINITPEKQGLQTNVCPDSIHGQMALWLVVMIIIVFIIISLVFKTKLIGVIASLGLVCSSWILAGCSGIIAYMIALIGMLLFFTFVLWKTYDKGPE